MMTSPNFQSINESWQALSSSEFTKPHPSSQEIRPTALQGSAITPVSWTGNLKLGWGGPWPSPGEVEIEVRISWSAWLEICHRWRGEPGGGAHGGTASAQTSPGRSGEVLRVLGRVILGAKCSPPCNYVINCTRR